MATSTRFLKGHSLLHRVANHLESNHLKSLCKTRQAPTYCSKMACCGNSSSSENHSKQVSTVETLLLKKPLTISSMDEFLIKLSNKSKEPADHTNEIALKVSQDETDSLPSYNLSFAGCGFLGIYHLGVATALVTLAPSFMTLNVKRFGGASAGALTAAILAVRGMDLETLKLATEFTFTLAKHVRSKRLGILSVDLLDYVKYFLDAFLPEDAHLKAEDNLFISVTRVNVLKNVLINNYDSRDDLFKCLSASAHIPGLTGKLKKFEIINNKEYIDGGLTENLPLIPGGRTISVSPFAGDQDVCPKEKHVLKRFKAVLNGQNFDISRNNIIRGLHAFKPPKLGVLIKYYNNGIMDAFRFLKKEGLLESQIKKSQREIYNHDTTNLKDTSL